MASYVDNLIAFIDRQRSMYGAQDEKAPVGPQPVITIDGVDYYHKQEFDLTKYDGKYDTSYRYNYDLLSGELITDTFGYKYSSIELKRQGRDSYENVARLVIDEPGMATVGFLLHQAPTDDIDVNYTSRAFNVVHEPSESEDDIYLPNNCTAFYGFLSDDHKTFISYFNIDDSSVESEEQAPIEPEGPTPIEPEGPRPIEPNE